MRGTKCDWQKDKNEIDIKLQEYYDIDTRIKKS